MNPYAPPDVRPNPHHHRHHHHHHHPQQPPSRYAPVPPSPRPPSRYSFPDNPGSYPPSQNLLHHNHHHHHRQPSHLPSPLIHQPPDYHPSPSALRPDYEFRSRGFNSIGEDQDRRLIDHHHQHQYRHPTGLAGDRRVLGGHDSAIAENQVHRQYSGGADYNRDVPRQGLGQRVASPYGPVDGSRRATEPIPRVRVRGDFAEGSGSRQQGNLAHGASCRFGSAGSYASDSQRNDRGDSMSGRYSWVQIRKDSRDSSDSLPEVTDFSVDGGEKVGTIPSRQEHHSLELGRYENVSRGSRDFSHDYHLTPKKQIQKKSAFSRLQAPRFNHQSKEKERSYRSNYDDENGLGSGSFKSKGQLQFIRSDHGPKDKREDGAVDLDVSFKSNTLIGKPVAPSTSIGFVSDKDSTPLSKKLKSAIVSSKDSMGSLPKKIVRFDLSNLMSDAAINISKKPKPSGEGVNAVKKYNGSFGQLEGIVDESNGPAKSGGGPQPVSEVNNVLSATYEVKVSSLSSGVQNDSIDFHYSRDTSAGQDSKTGASSCMSLDESENVSDRNAEREDPCTVPLVKDFVSDRQISNACMVRNDFSDRAGEKVGPGQGKTEEKGSPTRSNRDAIVEGPNSCSGAKTGIVSDKAGEIVESPTLLIKDAIAEGLGLFAGSKRDIVSDEYEIFASGEGEAVSKLLSGKAHPVKDTAIEQQDACAAAKSNAVPPGKTVKKGLPGKTPYSKDSGAGPKKEVVFHKALENVSPHQGKTVKKGLPGKLYPDKEAVAKGQYSCPSIKKDAVSHRAGHKVGSSQGKVVKKGLSGKIHLVKDDSADGKDSGDGAKKNAVSPESGGKFGSCQLELPGNIYSAKASVPKRKECSAVTINSHISLAEGRDSGAGTKKVVVPDNAGKAGGSCLSKTEKQGLPDKKPPFQIPKKKKIVKRMVKRVITRKADPQNQQPCGKRFDDEKSENSSRSESVKCPGSLQQEQENASDSMILTEEHSVTHYPVESVCLQQIDQKKGLTCSTSSPRYDQFTDKKIEVAFDHKKVDCVSSSLCPVDFEEKKVEALNCNNSLDSRQIVSSCMKNLSVSLAMVNDSNSTNEYSGQLHQDVECSLLEHEAVKDKIVEVCNKTEVSNLSEINIQDGSLVADGSSVRSSALSNSEDDFTGSQDLPFISGPCENSLGLIKVDGCLVSGSPATNSEKIFTSLSNVLSDSVRGQSPQVGGPIMLSKGGEDDFENSDQRTENSKESSLYPGRSCDGTFVVDSMTSGEANICLKPIGETDFGPSHVSERELNLSIPNPDVTSVSMSGGFTDCLPAITIGHNLSLGADGTDLFDANLSDDYDNTLGGSGTSPILRKRRKFSPVYPESADVTAPQDTDIPLVADTTTSEVLFSHSHDRSAQARDAVPRASSNVMLEDAPVSTMKESSILLEDINQVDHSDAMCVQVPGTHSSSCPGQPQVVNVESLSNLIGEGRPDVDHLHIGLVHDHQDGDIDHVRCEFTNLDLDNSEKQALSEIRRSRSIISDSFQFSDQQFIPQNIENNAILSLKDASPSPHVSFSGEVDEAIDGVDASKTHDEVMKSVPDVLPDMASEESSFLSNNQVPSGRAVRGQRTSEAVAKNIGIEDEGNLAVGGPSVSADFACTSVSHDILAGYCSDHSVEIKSLARDNALSFPSNGSRSLTCSPNQELSGEVYGRLNQRSHVIRKVSPNQSSITSTTSKSTSSSSTSRPNTWRRTCNSSATPTGIKPSIGTLHANIPLPGKNPRFPSTSYIRKGNSLVRRPASVVHQTQLPLNEIPVHRLNSSDMHNLKSTAVSGNTDDANGMVHSSTGERHTPIPDTPLSISNDSPSCNVIPSATLPSSQPASPPVAKCEDVGVTSGTQQDKNALLKISGSPNRMVDESLVISNLKKITYVKRKSNQLVAKGNDCDPPINFVEEKQGLPSEGYYKRNKNQLIWTPLDSVKQSLSDKGNMEGQQDAKNISSTSFGKRRFLKGASKLQTPLKSTLVWTLHGKSGNFTASNHHKVFPHLFPWKRTTYRRNHMRNSVSIGDSLSLSAIRKLMLSRQRDAVYIRSSHGLSLRKSKVVSVGGSSLKWSKSIERRSKKASEEATRAVAAAEKKKRERIGAPLASVAKNKGERIFRIGNERYKMDASRKTLIRISDDETSSSAASQPGTNAKKSYVPRRLVIGNDEYVRIGNGNQLVRDPKRRTRVLANEKVKWSLHTARLKLAKSRTYCQFFTRFGKCNKNDGKCPYIHDSSKIAVCTKFLSGSCTNKDCKLTHKVIPDRMPDCSFFLQGLCTNKSCSYRHVNVNPKASTCEGFLRGYCAKGDKCRKKHSYVCPAFESTGSCPLGSNCKLHHPKSRTRGKKRKRSKEKASSTGRYFGGLAYVRASDPGTSFLVDENSGSNRNDTHFEDNSADYISLDVIDEGEVPEEIGGGIGDEAYGDFDMELDDLDSLIKPVALMDVNV